MREPLRMPLARAPGSLLCWLLSETPDRDPGPALAPPTATARAGGQKPKSRDPWSQHGKDQGEQS